MNKKRACIFGISGQDGSYLAEFLLDKDYEVWGMLRRNSVAENQTARLDHIFNRLNLRYGDVTDIVSIISLLKESMPDEIYSLAAQSHVQISFIEPIYTAQVDAIGVMNILEAMRIVVPTARFYQASSSEMFGNNVDLDGYQCETTPMHPVSPYGVSKLFAYHLVRNYRHSYKLFATNGILFNHESPRRGSNFVTNKVAKAAVRIKKGLQDKLMLGNLDACRDWGHTKDYVRAMWLINNHSEPDDFVVATGISHSVKDLCTYVFNKLDLNYEDYIIQESKYFRPEELEQLKGNPHKAREILGWETEISFEEMLDEMIEYWLNFYK